MTVRTNKPTNTFWIISAVALLWNISGVVAYLAQINMTKEILEALPEADQAYYTHVPSWVTAVFAIAVFAGTFGCLSLLMKKKNRPQYFLQYHWLPLLHNLFTTYLFKNLWQSQELKLFGLLLLLSLPFS